MRWKRPGAIGPGLTSGAQRFQLSAGEESIGLPRPVAPFWSGRPMINGAIRPHDASLRINRSNTSKAASPKEALNHIS